MNSDNNETKSTNPLVAAAIGAAIGATAVILSEKDKRDKIKAKIQDGRNLAEERIKEASQKAGEMKEKARDEATSTLEKAKSKLENDKTRST